MRTVLFYIYFLIGLMGFSTSGHAQQTLDGYIKTGLSNNLTVSQKNLSLKKALNALQVAKNMYLPSISFDMTYTTANGGRAINLPVGDLLNPVYTTLNQLTQSEAFPQIANQEVNFLPRNYYDARIRTAMPLLNTDIKHNKVINEKLVILQEHEVEIYKRELVKEIKEAYYNYRSAVEASKIYQDALTLAQEGKRVNQKRLDAGSGLPAYVVRADAEIAQAEANVSGALQQQNNAQYYFNTLLNRSAEAPIAVDDKDRDIDALAVRSMAIDRREELDALNEQIQIQERLVRMNKDVFLPKLNAFVDVGSQAEQMRVNKDSPYYMIGAQLSFPIFEGNRNRLKINESKIAVAEAENSLLQVRQQLELAARVAMNEVATTRANYDSAQKQAEAAATYQRLIQRGFAEGVNTYLETIDARSQHTSAQMAANIAAYKYRIALAKLERETATYPLD